MKSSLFSLLFGLFLYVGLFLVGADVIMAFIDVWIFTYWPQLSTLTLLIGNFTLYLSLLLPLTLLFFQPLRTDWHRLFIQPKTTWKWLSLGVGAIAFLTFVGLFYLALTNSTLASANQSRIDAMFTSNWLGTSLFILILAPFVEEISFRFIPFAIGRRLYAPTWVLTLLSTLGFSLVHMNGSSDIFAMIPYLAIGLTLALIYAKSENIWLCIAVHSFNNLLSIGAILLQLL